MINDYLVRWSTANRNKVVSQLTHYETDSFAVQDQASHRAFNLMLPGCAPDFGSIDESIQSGWRMIA